LERGGEQWGRVRRSKRIREWARAKKFGEGERAQRTKLMSKRGERLQVDEKKGGAKKWEWGAR